VSEELIVAGGHVIDLDAATYVEADLRIRDGRIVEIASNLVGDADSRRLEIRGAFVIPGLIDAHVHVTLAALGSGWMRSWSPRYAAFKAATMMSAMLDRGFTSVRDTGGADYGLCDAQAEGLIRGPRLFFGGRALSQTGGHGDHRERAEHLIDDHPGCSTRRIADGVDEVRRAARDELRKGAHHIKVMASGGVASPTDRVDSTQYSMEELSAAVEEATAAHRYVAAHAYSAEAVNRALRAGIRTIEHGNFLDEESVRLFQEKGAYLIMNMVTYWALEREGREHGLSDTSWMKAREVLEGGMRGLTLAAEGGVPIGYGTDLLGPMQRYQNEEFAIRAELQANIDVLRSATSVAAEIICREGELGVIAPGALGDLVVLQRDPLEDVKVLAAPDEFLYVIQGGQVVHSRDR